MSLRHLAEAQSRAVDRLAEIAKLDKDWDTYDGLAPARLAVASAGQLIISVAERLIDEVGEAVAPYAVMPFPLARNRPASR